MKLSHGRLSSAVGFAATLVAGALALPGTGCSSQRDALSRDLEQLRTEVKQLRADSLALQDRIEALEQHPRASAPDPAAPAGSAANDRPQLSVVRLLPQPDEPAAVAPPDPPAAEDGGSRAVLVGDKNGARIEQAGGAGAKPGPAGARGNR